MNLNSDDIEGKESTFRIDQKMDREKEIDLLQSAKHISDHQFFQRRPKTAKDVINKLMARKGYNQTEANIELQNAWESIIDTRMKNKTRASKVRGGYLEIVVENSVLNHELTFNKSILLKKFKALPIGKRIKDIRFKIGEIN